jgi:hypothetical protein
MATVIWLFPLGSCVWVYFDARELGIRKGRLGGGGLDMSPTSWVICCALLWLIAFPAYLVARGRYRALSTATPAPTAVQPWAAPAAVIPVQSRPTQQAAPPQLSADGHWWWNGAQWVPATGAGSAAPFAG